MPSKTEILQLSLLWLSALALSPPQKRIVAIDTDPAWSLPFSLLHRHYDIDDNLVLLMAIAAEWRHEIQISAVTATYGNSGSSDTFGDALNLLRQAGATVPAARSGNWFDSLSTVSNGTHLLASTLSAAMGRNETVSVLCIGSMHTLAAVLAQRPELLPGVGHLVMLGGSTGTGSSILQQAADLNFWAAPEATAALLELDIPRTVVPIQTCLGAAVTNATLSALKSCSGSVVSAHAARLDHWMNQMGNEERLVFGHFPEYVGAPMPWDVVALQVLMHPEWFGGWACFKMSMNGPILKHEQLDSTHLCHEAGGRSGLSMVPTRILNLEAFNEALVKDLCSVGQVAPSAQSGS